MKETQIQYEQRYNCHQLVAIPKEVAEEQQHSVAEAAELLQSVEEVVVTQK